MDLPRSSCIARLPSPGTASLSSLQVPIAPILAQPVLSEETSIRVVGRGYSDLSRCLMVANASEALCATTDLRAPRRIGKKGLKQTSEASQHHFDRGVPGRNERPRAAVQRQ